MELKTTIEHRYQLEADGAVSYSSAVFRATDLCYQRKVLVKRFSYTQELAKVQQLPAFIRQHKQEGMAQMRIAQFTPFVPRIYEMFYDEATRAYCIVMELIQGTTLAEKMKKLAVSDPARKFPQYIIELCGLLDVLEKQRIHHYDIKPANVLIDPDDHVYLIDFGTANETLAAAGNGTPAYRAPELQGEASRILDRSKADIYSVGVMLYEFYTGELPVLGKTHILKARARDYSNAAWTETSKQPKDINPKIPEKLNDIICKCMKASPKDRYQSAGALQRDFKNYCRGGGQGKKRRG